MAVVIVRGHLNLPQSRLASDLQALPQSRPRQIKHGDIHGTQIQKALVFPQGVDALS